MANERCDCDGKTPTNAIFVSMINFHEQMQGWLAFLNRVRTASLTANATDFEKVLGLTIDDWTR